MSKILGVLFLFFSFFLTTFADSELKIISREEWGADENYRYIDSPEWKSILEKRKKASEAWKLKLEKMTDLEKKANEEKSRLKIEKRQKINSILLNEFGDDQKLRDIVKEQNGHKLAWPIEKSQNIKGIIIHHTVSEYADSYEGIKAIYKFHALNREWGDIGYNYLIGNNGEIFEGRAGGDYAVGAQSVWNNRSTLGIAIIGNFTNKPINQKQYNSLKKLIEYLSIKYKINLNSKFNYHSICISGDCKEPLDSFKLPAIIGHRDSGHTSCPGDELYAQINTIRRELSTFVSLNEKTKDKIKMIVRSKIPKFSLEKLYKILISIEKYLDKNIDYTKIQALMVVKEEIFEYIKSEDTVLSSVPDKESDFDSTSRIKIKLSYPYNDKISISKEGEYINVYREGNSLRIGNKKQDFLRIPGNKCGDKKIDCGFLKITSWDRKPAWDSSGKLNDNTFKGDILLYVKDGKLVVVNDIILKDYLKGLGEVSNNENEEKLKTIIVSARTYARWYMGEKYRKFPGEMYDGSDDPNVFQKYLGYGLEIRSPKINSVVESTKNQVITYSGELIKPWYFSSSDGKTLSFIEYCSKNSNNISDYCNLEAKKYPFLTSVPDPSASTKLLGHGVGIPGTGVKYLSERGWDYVNIIKYFLKGVEVGKM